ncbi:hypothetical protein KBA27_04765 [bacterium]|nr:hypothetical protein [bacterium]
MTMQRTTIFTRTCSPYKGENLSRVDMARMGQVYNNSIFCNNGGNSNYYNSVSDTAEKAEKYANIAMGISGGIALGSLALGIVGLFKGRHKLNSENASMSGNATGNADVSEATADRSQLKAEMKKADKTGDWAPVKEAYDNAVAEKEENESKVAECNDSIKNSKTAIESTEKHISDTKQENEDLKTQVSGYEDEMNKQQAIIDNPKASEADKTAAKTGLETAKKNKVKAEDKIKQNKTKITEYQKTITQEKENIKAQTKTAAEITKANSSLQKTIADAKKELDLRDLNTEAKTEAKKEEKSEETKKEDKSASSKSSEKPLGPYEDGAKKQDEKDTMKFA